MASKPAFWLTIFTIWVSTCSGSTLPAFTKATRDVENPIDPKWVQNFAAIGDSYAAGIGAGNVLNGDGYGKCSRYDESYPRMMQYMGYGGDPKFTFLACSGDKSGDVMGQVKKLEDNSQDLVTVSAGGNDALLSDVLKACVFLPSSLEKCKSKLADTKKEIDDTLQNSIDDLLQALAPKVKSGGIIAYSLYAQFFNADTDACSDQSWNWFKGLLPNTNGEIKLTKDLRKQMNDLVVEANTKIKGAIASQSGSTRPSKATIVIADWDKTVGDIKGRLCEKDSADDPADPSNAGLAFQRLNTKPGFILSDRSLERREETSDQIYQKLERRIPVPDAIGKVFHPSILGNEIIAATTMMAINEQRLKGYQGSPACAKQPFQPPPESSTDPKCDMDRISGLPGNVWRVGDVYGKFCEEVEKSPTKDLSWIVDGSGNKIPPKMAKSKRSPPPDPTAYNDYQITLNWKGGDGACGKGCKTAFGNMGQSPCSNTAGEQNIMACAASSGTGCGPGTFDYSIKPGAGSGASCEKKSSSAVPKPKPAVCTEISDDDIKMCGWTDISKATLNDAVNGIQSLPKGPQDLSKFQNQTFVYNRSQNPTYMLNIGVVPGCKEFDKQVIDNPQGKSGDPASVSISATDIFRHTYDECTGNKGLGGYIDYGCVRYGFYPTKIKGIFSDTTPKHYEYYWDAENKWCGDDVSSVLGSIPFIHY